MLDSQDPPPENDRLKHRSKQFSLSHCMLLERLGEDGLFRRCRYAEIQPEAFSNAEMRKTAII
jgi:hypothetical protein